MPHPYRIREIAEQSGLSLATVDRVLHGRPGVRASTVAEVHRAIADLDRQSTQVRLAGRTFLVDLVMHAPERFSGAVRTALEAELPDLRPAAVRTRFHLREAARPDDLAATLDRIGSRGSHGVLLKAPDHPAVADAVGRLADRGVPVVTLVTDLPTSRRLASVGIDDRAAGATAAYLLTQWGGDGSVLVTLSSSAFRGEGEREAGFRAALDEMAPGRPVRAVTETDGLDATMLREVARALDDDPRIDAVYSIGGGNVATLRAFADAGRTCRAFVAHDLDADNTRLLRERRVSAVLHHDLRRDVRRACRMVMQAHGALPGVPSSVPSAVQVVTPFNEPPAVFASR
ncbi:LacI family DNA-binding transcriptional regulator [Solicola sp. PLA-1-18]|uniref:LacI family DNA-binding transcriptional regulator n=1 Tax=Solicola sp. PLA-1-18 TaxID=3380532 RepID=UPI003B799F65